MKSPQVTFSLFEGPSSEGLIDLLLDDGEVGELLGADGTLSFEAYQVCRLSEKDAKCAAWWITVDPDWRRTTRPAPGAHG